MFAFDDAMRILIDGESDRFTLHRHGLLDNLCQHQPHSWIQSTFSPRFHDLSSIVFAATGHGRQSVLPAEAIVEDAAALHSN